MPTADSQSPARPHGDGALPGWYRTAAAASWRFLAIAASVFVVMYALVHLRVIVLPIIVAVLASTLLLPLVRWLKGHRVPDGLAAAISMLAAVLALAAVLTAIAPSLASQFGDLRTKAEDGVREATDQLAKPPFNLSERDIRTRVNEGLEGLRENSGPLARGLSSGAILLGEVLTGLIVAVLLCFFLLKDGEQIWAWVVRLFGERSRHHADEVGARVYTALAGYVRGIAMVGLVDAILIAIALVLVGVPLVVPLAVITFFAAFVPLIGAFVAGLLAVLIAFVSGGTVDALLVLGAIVLVQQVEGHLLYPLLMSRAVHLHPAVIVIALAAGGILAGIVGVFLAVPVAGGRLGDPAVRPGPPGPGLTAHRRRARGSGLKRDSSSATPIDQPMCDLPGTLLGTKTREMACPRRRSSPQAAAMPAASTAGQDAMRPGLSG
jgi:predicted PurR-regulated permease PerM